MSSIQEDFAEKLVVDESDDAMKVWSADAIARTLEATIGFEQSACVEEEAAQWAGDASVKNEIATADMEKMANTAAGQPLGNLSTSDSADENITAEGNLPKETVESVAAGGVLSGRLTPEVPEEEANAEALNDDTSTTSDSEAVEIDIDGYNGHIFNSPATESGELDDLDHNYDEESSSEETDEATNDDYLRDGDAMFYGFEDEAVPEGEYLTDSDLEGVYADEQFEVSSGQGNEEMGGAGEAAGGEFAVAEEVGADVAAGEPGAGELVAIADFEAAQGGYVAEAVVAQGMAAAGDGQADVEVAQGQAGFGGAQGQGELGEAGGEAAAVMVDHNDAESNEHVGSVDEIREVIELLREALRVMRAATTSIRYYEELLKEHLTFN